MRKILTPVRLLAVVVVGVLSACGSSSSDDAASTPQPASIVVTTNVLGDMVTEALGDLVGIAVDVEVIMPIGADPHGFAPSARQAETMENADLLVVNGLGFEAGMIDTIANALDRGAIGFPIGGTLEWDETTDPHVWMDPAKMADVFTRFGQIVSEATSLDADAVAVHVAAYVDELRALDATIATTLGGIPSERRLLVTNHDSLSYFADRYDLEVLGTVIPSVSTSAEASAADLERLAALIRANEVPAIFVETTESGRLAEALAAEVGNDIQVVELYTGSLGAPGSGAETYVGFMSINAERIAAALG